MGSCMSPLHVLAEWILQHLQLEFSRQTKRDTQKLQSKFYTLNYCHFFSRRSNPRVRQNTSRDRGGAGAGIGNLKPRRTYPEACRKLWSWWSRFFVEDIKTLDGCWSDQRHQMKNKVLVARCKARRKLYLKFSPYQLNKRWFLLSVLLHAKARYDLQTRRPILFDRAFVW